PAAARAPAPAAAEKTSGPGWRSRSLWFVLSACGSGLLLATTNQLTLNVSVVPFMWILPFSLYLLSFILCFDGERFYTRRTWLVFLACACAGVCYLLYSDISVPALLQIAICSLTLFIACMVCHGELAGHKPRPEYLTGFYVLVSAGGAFGGALVAVAAPLIFRGPWEYPLFWLLVPSIMLALALREEKTAVSVSYRAVRLIAICLYLVFAGALYGYYRLETRSMLVMERNFYGTLQVFESDYGGSKIFVLMHGQINHGFQFTEDDPRSKKPVSYYGPASGVGVAIRALHKPRGRRPLHMGVVGLGAGVIAAWALPGDRLTFYEINPLVLRLSGEYFTYLRDSSAGGDIVMGDARLSLEREAAAAAEPLDLLVIDAFSSDAIPLHLLTREAFAVYFKRLRPDGVLAVHLSNLFLDLEPLVRGLAQEAGKKTVLIDNPEDEAAGSEAATWMLITGNEKFLSAPLVKAGAAALPADPKTLVFTDQYSNLFRLLRH
ncbi:MAG: fused MFS/spermidine synthase, partial [Elusimicrobiota bacterium]|nr:fused MFS/spermidine synthase [Elusimicrobiota bacterium]